MLTKFCFTLMFSAVLMGGYLQQQYLNRPSRLRANEFVLKQSRGELALSDLTSNLQLNDFQSTNTNISVSAELETGGFVLVVGCLHGNFRQNNFSIEVTPENEAVKTPSSSGVLVPAHPQLTSQAPIRSAGVFESSAVPKEEQTTRPLQTCPSPQGYTFYGKQTPPRQRPFSLFTGEGSFHDANNYSAVQAILLAESEHLRIWYDNAHDDLDTESSTTQHLKPLALKTACTFETVIVKKLQPWLGEVADLDRDGKFSILLSPKLNKLKNNSVSLEGLTWSGDYRRGLGSPFGNQADVLYLNSRTSNLDLISTVLVHEYVHAIGFDLRLQRYHAQLQEQLEEDWVNEALAHIVETQLGNSTTNIGYRVDGYRCQTESYPLVVPSYYRANLWRSHGCRGAAYSFLKWCVSQQGTTLIPRLLHSESRGIENIEQHMQQPFSQLFRQWTVSQATELDHSQLKNNRLDLKTAYSWAQAATSVRYFVLNIQDAGRYRVSLKNESESGVQLTLLPLPDSKAEDSSIYCDR